jgi:ECF sigma factor
VRAPSPLELYAAPTTGSNPASWRVELRYFGGLPVPEAARSLGVSPRTADRLRAFARAWPLLEAGGDAPDEQDTDNIVA